MSGKKIEGYWDCAHCDTKGIGGLTKTCPNCGNPQAKDVKFYLKTGTKKYLEPEIAEDYGKGADWVCAFCGSYNRYNATSCKNCGAAKADAEEDYFGRKVKVIPEEDYNLEEYEPDEEPSSPSYEEEDRRDNTGSYDTSDYISSNTCNKEDETYLSKAQSFFSNVNFKAILGIAGGIAATIALIVILISIFTPKNYDAQISDKTWNRSVTIQELRTLKEDDWDVPAGGRVYDERKEIRTYDHKIDHYDTEEYQVSRQEFDHYDYEYVDNGDGTFTEKKTPVYVTVYDTKYRKVPVYVDIPVYDIKYYYKIDRWCYDRTAKSSGKTDNPYWPEFNLASKERESGRNETYTVYFKVDEKTYSKNFSYEEWKAYRLGSKVTITVVAGIVTEVEP